jgi:hypothetical protein
LRALEIELLKEIYNDGQLDVLADTLSVVDVDQFYGIEIGEFPARIAETALWMMDHIMNNRLSLEFGQTYVRIPLKKSPHIVHGDALETDWTGLLPPEKCSYVFGNPTFIGAKYQSNEQRAQVRGIANLGKTGGTLDFVTAWFIKAGEYIRGTDARIGFVATNSITQGEQVAQLWPVLFGRCKLEIAFAHRTFAWGSDARGKAHVHVVILGLTPREHTPQKKRLFSYPDINGEPDETRHTVLSPYLFDASALSDPHLVVREVSKPTNGLPKLITGSKPIDDGNFILSFEEYQRMHTDDPEFVTWFRPFIGAREFIQGSQRYIVHPASIPTQTARTFDGLLTRLEAVRRFRNESKSGPTQAIADTPSEFHVTVIPSEPFLAIPQVSSERRQYAPIGWINPPAIPSDKLRVLLGATRPIFAILTSSMHMAWMRAITGRMKSDYMYSVGVVYNTFPMPPVSDAELTKLDPLAQTVLDARNAHPDSTLADLYDPDLMPANLRAVDRLYRRSGFASDRERVEYLLALYEKTVAPLTAGKPKRRRSGTKKATPAPNA